MIITSDINAVREFVKKNKKEGKSVALVPTMGYLHEGHASLIAKARKENDIVVVSIFVNPTQFGPNEDYAFYPRDIDNDAALCENIGVDLIFNPTPETMYGKNYYTSVSMNTLTENLCGLSRPVHFGGVCTVVAKLFNIVTPDNAYFGQKDAQQLAIIRQMTKDLNFDINIVGCPIVRENDGLAKSSRNVYLSNEERKSALILSKTIFLAQKIVREGEKDAKSLLKIMEDNIKSEPRAKIDYIKVVDGLTIQDIEIIEKPTLVAMAVYIGKTRLIDNFIFD
ncbi:MAG: pantoate--beta-alanine ligase [Synergistaceae bacterium]